MKRNFIELLTLKSNYFKILISFTICFNDEFMKMRIEKFDILSRILFIIQIITVYLPFFFLFFVYLFWMNPMKKVHIDINLKFHKVNNDIIYLRTVQQTNRRRN